MNKAVVVFSGGQDSTTCLLWALTKFDEVHAVTFDYKQRHSTEIESAKNICKDFEVEHHILDMTLLNQLTESALTRDIAIDESDNIPNTFVPGRNLIFLSFATILAHQIGAKNIVTGVCETDFSGYPDCREDFIKSLNQSLNLAIDTEFKIHTPLMYLTKAQTWALADDLGYLDYIRDETVTCYNGIKGDGCGTCPSCKLRAKGLNEYLQIKLEENKK